MATTYPIWGWMHQDKLKQVLKSGHRVYYGPNDTWIKNIYVDNQKIFEWYDYNDVAQDWTPVSLTYPDTSDYSGDISFTYSYELYHPNQSYTSIHNNLTGELHVEIAFNSGNSPTLRKCTIGQTTCSISSTSWGFGTSGADSGKWYFIANISGRYYHTNYSNATAGIDFTSIRGTFDFDDAYNEYNRIVRFSISGTPFCSGNIRKLTASFGSTTLNGGAYTPAPEDIPEPTVGSLNYFCGAISKLSSDDDVQKLYKRSIRSNLIPSGEWYEDSGVHLVFDPKAQFYVQYQNGPDYLYTRYPALDNNDYFCWIAANEDTIYTKTLQISTTTKLYVDRNNTEVTNYTIHNISNDKVLQLDASPTGYPIALTITPTSDYYQSFQTGIKAGNYFTLFCNVYIPEEPSIGDPNPNNNGLWLRCWFYSSTNDNGHVWAGYECFVGSQARSTDPFTASHHTNVGVGNWYPISFSTKGVGYDPDDDDSFYAVWSGTYYNTYKFRLALWGWNGQSVPIYIKNLSLCAWRPNGTAV